MTIYKAETETDCTTISSCTTMIMGLAYEQCRLADLAGLVITDLKNELSIQGTDYIIHITVSTPDWLASDNRPHERKA
jgi:hypothetical protein